MSIQLVIGKAGHDHVTAANFGSLIAGMFGSGKYVLATGNKMAAEILSANSIVIKDGDAIMGGRHITIPHGTTETATIENGTQGQVRRDVIYIKYEAQSSGIESATIAVQKGTPGSDTRPSVPQGNILNGSSSDAMPLYEVRLNGVAVDSVTPLFAVKNPSPSFVIESAPSNNNDGMPDGTIHIRLL